jgi:hypothetical protein
MLTYSLLLAAATSALLKVEGGSTPKANNVIIQLFEWPWNRSVSSLDAFPKYCSPPVSYLVLQVNVRLS